jgi:hypothetical protein
MSRSITTMSWLTCTAALLWSCGREATLPAPSDPEGGNSVGSTGGGNVAGGKPGTGTGTSTGSDGDGTEALPEVARSTRSSLQWKRHAAFEADLAQALALRPDELCNEFGKDSCIRGVHMSPLGGHNPFTTGLLESSVEPLVTTSTVTERVVLSACLARIDKDRALGDGAVVFAGIALDGSAPAPEDDTTRSLINTLYRRLLARDAEPFELDTLAALSRDEQGVAVTGATFAASVCMAIGTTTEFLFF